ncbi:ATP-independent periplasmic protein-refolding chaperone Spy [Acerihabitans arboris]|uniref:ATP-independent periplasmic protein-refolding chaperone n=1 Tax=Acerihabitans arboris TaxID=2691583 RepID=A0A845SI38_9GAMM|nr:ATP-independent periplasmic protein-refolding chaperone Spy [Acerihabitans arboris]NDL63042.1 ATP-independent periplasmic protein-refolding chaperone [Acerihabitans arboris]
MRKLTALFMATTLVLGSVQLASAADTTAATDNAPAKGEMHHKGDMQHRGGPMMMDHMFKDLKLTEQQRQKMHDIARDSMKDMKKPSAAEHQQMHDVIAADSFDSTKAQALVSAMSQDQNQRMLANLEMQNKMYNVLTPEQKTEFNKKFQERAEKMQQRDAK